MHIADTSKTIKPGKKQEKIPYYLSQLQKQPHGVQLPSGRFIDTNKVREIDNIYLNVVINHEGLTTTYPNGPTGTVVEVGAKDTNSEYDVTKTIPILDKCSDYYCSIVRFSIPLDTVPLMIMPIVPNQIRMGVPPHTDPNLTPLIIGIRFGGVNYSLNLEYVSRANPILFPPPEQDLPLQVITPYYFVFSYQVLIDMLNTALQQLLINSGIAALLPAPPTPPLINPNQPFFFLDPDTNLISLVYPKYFANITSPLTTLPVIFINSLLKNYLDSFDFFFFQFDQPQGRDFDFVLVEPTPDKIYYPPNFVLPANATAAPVQSPIIFYREEQEYSVLEYWSSLRKIIIATNTIPINTEYVPSPGLGLNGNGGSNVSFPIISDFIPNIDQSAGISRSIAFYLPQAQYRLVDMISDNPLQKIDLKLFWQDIAGNLYPLTVSAFQQSEIKLGFFRKSLYKESLRLTK